MTRLDEYRDAMLAVFADVPEERLEQVLDTRSTEFVSFVIDHGLGPVWHARLGRAEFHGSRMAAESLYLAQQRALADIDAALNEAGIAYAVIKGAANRLLLHDNPAVRAGYDIDLLVHPDDRVITAESLIRQGYFAHPKARTISHELELSHDTASIDLHWGVLREGRLRHDPVAGMLARRRRTEGISILHEDDAFFLLLVHPAFAKHLAGWNMGLHRVADIYDWLRTYTVDWETLHERFADNGVKTAAWATLRWVQLLTEPHFPGDAEAAIDEAMTELQPGYLRRAWLGYWLRADLSARLYRRHWATLFGFSVFLHDSPGDALRALRGRSHARRREAADLAAFAQLLSQ